MLVDCTGNTGQHLQCRLDPVMFVGSGCKRAGDSELLFRKLQNKLSDRSTLPR